MALSINHDDALKEARLASTAHIEQLKNYNDKLHKTFSYHTNRRSGDNELRDPVSERHNALDRTKLPPAGFLPKSTDRLSLAYRDDPLHHRDLHPDSWDDYRTKDKSEITEYRDKYPGWKVSLIQRNDAFNRNVDSIIKSIVTDQTPSNWKSEHKDEYQDPKIDVDSSIVGKQFRRSDHENPLNKDSNQKIPVSEQKEKYIPHEYVKNDEIVNKKRLTSTSFIHQSDEEPWQSEHRNSFLPVTKFDDAPVAGKKSDTSTPFLNAFRSVGHDEQKSSEYKDKYVAWDPSILSLRKIREDNVRSSVIVPNDAPCKWSSEYDDKFVPLTTNNATFEEAKLIKQKLLDHVDLTQNIVDEPAQSEYREKYQPVPFVKDPQSSENRNRIDSINFHDGEVPKWKSEYDDKFVPLTTDNATFEEAKLIKQKLLDHVDLTQNIVDEPAQSEYREKYQPMPFVKDPQSSENRNRIDSINFHDGEVPKWKSEYDDKYVQLTPDNKAFEEAAIIKQKVIDHVSISDDPNSNRVNKSEYKEKYQAHSLNSSADNVVSKRNKVDSVNFFDPSITEKSWQSIYKQSYQAQNSISNLSSAGKLSKPHDEFRIQQTWQLQSESKPQSEYKSAFIPKQLEEYNNYEKSIQKKLTDPTALYTRDDSYLPSTWKSEYDFRCAELRKEMDALKATSIIRSPIKRENKTPMNFAWAPIKDEGISSPFMKIEPLTEYKERYNGRQPVERAKSALKQGSTDLFNRSSTLRPWITEYDDKYWDYSSFDEQKLSSPVLTSDLNIKPSDLSESDERKSFLVASVPSESIEPDSLKTTAIDIQPTTSHSDVKQWDADSNINEPAIDSIINVARKSQSSPKTSNKAANHSEKIKPTQNSRIPVRNVSTESIDLMLNTSPISGSISSKLLKDYKLSKKLRRPSYITEAQSQFTWPRVKQEVASQVASKNESSDHNIRHQDEEPTNDTSEHNKLSKATTVLTDPISEMQKATSPVQHRVSSETVHKIIEPNPAGKPSRQLRLSYSEELKRRRSKSAPNHRSVFSNADDTNILFHHPRFPQESDKHFGRWISETHASY